LHKISIVCVVVVVIDDEKKEKRREKRRWHWRQSIDQISLAFFSWCMSVFLGCSFLIVQIGECTAVRQINSIDIIRKFLGGREGVLW